MAVFLTASWEEAQQRKKNQTQEPDASDKL